MRLFRSHQHRHGDGHVLAMRSRFIPDGILYVFERRAHGRALEAPTSATGLPVRLDVAARDERDVGLGEREYREIPAGIRNLSS
jgi:hypothetical protein